MSGRLTETLSSSGGNRRESNLDAGSLPERRDDFYLRAVRVGDPSSDRQSKSRSLAARSRRIAAIKPVEDVWHLIG